MNYYKCLGVQPDAEYEVIKAAYKALSKKYHPDTSSHPKSEAEARMKEINKAYDVLSNPAKRKEYDNEFDSSQYAADDDENINKAFDDYFEEKWEFATEYFPSLPKYFKELSDISSTLAQSYRIAIILSQDYDKASSTKDKMLNDFLIRYFGNHKTLHEFALYLIKNKEKEAAMELNKAIGQFGNTVSYWELKDKIITKFNINMTKQSTTDHEQEDYLNPPIILLLVFSVIIFITFMIANISG